MCWIHTNIPTTAGTLQSSRGNEDMYEEFRDEVMNLFPSKQVFMTQCPLLLPSSPKHELVVDFLYILHQPPPPDVQTFS